MGNLLIQKQWNWLVSGIFLGIVFFAAVLLVKPIGVSTQFVIFDGIIWNLFSEELVVKDESAKQGYSSPNAYLNKSGGKYAKSIAEPLNYSFVFVLAVIAGGFAASRLQSEKESVEDLTAPPIWYSNFGRSAAKRYVYAFISGVLVLFGARLAGGCASGHMMSGMMQTSLSGYMFAAGVFAAAVPVAIYMYRKGQ